MLGMNGTTGAALDGVSHLKQSIRDLLATRKGSRVMREEYGSDVPDLVDAPMNRSTIAKIYAAVADALTKWEPRLQVTKIEVVAAEAGKLTLRLTGKYLPEGKTVTLDGVTV